MRRLHNSELWQSFLDILFPGSCLGCGVGLAGRQEVSYCSGCMQRIRLIRPPLCKLCGTTFENAGGESHLCGYCLGRGWNFNRARAAVRYQPPITEALKSFKYLGKMYALASFAALAQEYFGHCFLEQPDLILPVPLHVRRLRQRGFNQALILARKIFPQYQHLIKPGVLERHHWLRPQTGLKGSERRRNVKDAFRVQGAELVKNKKILLVDDVFTTGATVNECAGTLRKAGAVEISVFTLARVIDAT